MKKIINKILQTTFDLFFSKADTETGKHPEIIEILSSIARLNNPTGDQTIKYPCPAYSFFIYHQKHIRNMIWRLKYKGDKAIASLFASEIHNQFCDELSELAEWSNFRAPLLIPIPISKTKMRLRGFNQSAAICKALQELDQGRFFDYTPNVLYKIKDTVSQARVKDRAERLKNLRDSFAVRDMARIKNQNIILLDDVLTTGSTLLEATKILKKAGAKNIIWLVVAH